MLKCMKNTCFSAKKKKEEETVSSVASVVLVYFFLPYQSLPKQAKTLDSSQKRVLDFGIALKGGNHLLTIEIGY